MASTFKPEPSQWYTINVRHSDLVLTIESASTSNGAHVIQSSQASEQAGGTAQQFAFTDAGNDGYFIKARHSNLSLDVEGGSTQSGANIIQWPWHGQTNQIFDIQDASAEAGTYNIVSRRAGLLLTIQGGSTQSGSRLVQSAASGQANQRFRFDQVLVSQNGLPPSTGDAAIDNRIAQLSQSGFSFKLFNVPFSTPFRFSGNITVSRTSTSISFTGTASLDSPFNIDVGRLTITLALGNLSADATVRIDCTLSVADLVQQQVKPKLDATSWKIIDAILMSYLRLYDTPSIIISNADGSDDDLGSIVSGVNFYKSLKPSDIEPFKTLNNTFSMLKLDQRQVLLHTAAKPPNPAVDFLAEVTLVLNQEMGTKAVVLNTLGLLVEPSTGEVAAAATVQLTLKLGNDTLLITGGLQGTVGTGGSVVIWGALDAANGEWKDPFGIKGFSIVGFGAQIGAASTFPWIVLGVRGEARIGGNALQASVAALFDASDPSASVLQLESPQGINLIKLIQGLLSATALTPINKLGINTFDLALTDLLIYVAPKGATIAGKDYAAGFALKGKLDLFGYHASIDGKIDYASGGYLYGSMDKILLKAGGVSFFEVTDAAGSGSPLVKIDFTTAKQGIRISGRVSMLNGAFYQSVDVTADKTGFDISFDSNAKGLYQGAKASFRNKEFAAALAASFSFGFNLYGQDFNVGVKASIAVKASLSKFEQTVGFGYSAFGSNKSLGPITWTTPLPDAAAVKAVFDKYPDQCGDAIKKFFTEMLKSGTDQAISWVKNNVVNNADKIGKLFVAAGADKTRVAQGLVSQCGQTAEQATKIVTNDVNEAASIMKNGFNKSASETGDFLKSSYGASANAVNSALKGVGYASNVVDSYMKKAFGWFPHVDHVDLSGY